MCFDDLPIKHGDSPCPCLQLFTQAPSSSPSPPAMDMPRVAPAALQRWTAPGRGSCRSGRVPGEIAGPRALGKKRLSPASTYEIYKVLPGSYQVLPGFYQVLPHCLKHVYQFLMDTGRV